MSTTIVEPKIASRGLARRILRGTLILLLIGASILTFTFRHAWFTENFGVVDPGRVYRIAQPSNLFPDLIRKNHLASVLNLRGGSSDDPWYVNEVRATDEAGVDLYDFPMSATRRPKRRELLNLIEILNRCRYPLLIHCKSGADRTGLASALYLMIQKDEEPRSALRAFSVEYGHFPLGSSQTLHEPIDEYAEWLSREQLAHTPERFETWVEKTYKSDDAYAEQGPIMTGPRGRNQGLGRNNTPALPRR